MLVFSISLSLYIYICVYIFAAFSYAMAAFSVFGKNVLCFLDFKLETPKANKWNCRIDLFESDMLVVAALHNACFTLDLSIYNNNNNRHIAELVDQMERCLQYVLPFIRSSRSLSLARSVRDVRVCIVLFDVFAHMWKLNCKMSLRW